MLIALLFLLAVGIVLLLVAVLATRRQLCLGRKALLPVELTFRSSMDARLREAPIVSVPAMTGEFLTIGGASRDPRPLLLLFIEHRSALSAAVVRDAVVLTGQADARLLVVGDGEVVDYHEILSETGIDRSDLILDPVIREDFLIGMLPSAVLVDACGMIRARGTVQRSSQLEAVLQGGEGAEGAEGAPAMPSCVIRRRRGQATLP